jgi:hypothetical protein
MTETRCIWNLYKADKQIQGYSSQTLKVYKMQMSLSINTLGVLRLLTLQQDPLNYILEKLHPSCFRYKSNEQVPESSFFIILRQKTIKYNSFNRIFSIIAPHSLSVYILKLILT